MEHARKVERIKAMLAQVAEAGVESLRPAGEDGAESAAGQGALAGASASLADSGMAKLMQGHDDQVTPDEASSIEAIVLLRERPVFFVDGGSYAALPYPWTSLNAQDVKTRLQTAIKGIGRIELPSQPLIPYGGTGFIVGNGLMMTNRHVAQLFSRGIGVDGLLFSQGDAAVDFGRERRSAPEDRSTRFEVDRVLMVHPYWDMALLKVRGLDDRQPLVLSIAEPAEGQDVVVIGYPARDDRNDLVEQDRIFGRVYNVKRFHPGRIRPRSRIRSFEQVVNAVTHDASTLGGCSGSAIVDPGSGQVVALHFAGQYLVANYGVPTLELARDPRVVDAGVCFAGALPPTGEWDGAWRRAAGTEAGGRSAGSSLTGAAAPAPRPAASTSSALAPGEPVTWEVPLFVTVTLGARARVDAAAARADAPATGALGRTIPVATEAMRIPIIYDGLDERDGYQPGLLGTPVPLPELTERGKKAAATLEDGTHVLKYDKFSIVMHKRRRLAIFTAANVDWRQESRLVNGKKPTRKQLTGLGEGDIEKWVTDWRIPEDHQLPDIFYTKDGGAFDKGHLVRRDDVAWGADIEAMQRSNGDTYHTTNCSPQISGFNQSARGEDNWGDLENLVQKQTRMERAVVLSGPALANDDPLFDGRGDSGATIVLRIPRRFWKIIVALDPDSAQAPQAFGFVLEQDLSAVPTREEFLVPPPWRRHMRSVAEIERMLGGLATLGPVKAWDQYEQPIGEAVKRAARV